MHKNSIQESKTRLDVFLRCKAAGVTFVGIQEFKGRHLVYFNHSSNGSTLTLWLEDGFTLKKIKDKVNGCIGKYGEESGSDSNEPKIGG